MIESTGSSYQSSKFAKALMASTPKVGKTCFTVGQALGVFPWQEKGGVVSKPANLHVFTFDANALGGVSQFLKQTCGAPEEALGFRVYNLQDDARLISLSQKDYDATFYNTVMATLVKFRDRVAKEGGVHLLLISSLTGLSQALERGVIGPPKVDGGGGYANPDKWKLFGHQLSELRNLIQADGWHSIWEAHVDKGQGMGFKNEAPAKETIHVSGSVGRNFAYNVEQVFKIQRQAGDRFKQTNCDLMYLDTRPALDFIANGRGFTEALAPKEYDMALAFGKLGLQVGGWRPGK